MASNTITDLTNTRWLLNDTLAGTNIPPGSDYSTVYELNADLDGIKLLGLAFVKNYTWEGKFIDRDNNILSVVSNTGILLSAISAIDSTWPTEQYGKFLKDCEKIGIYNFDAGAGTPSGFKKAMYMDLVVTNKAGNTAVLSPMWSTECKNRLLTIYGGNDSKDSNLIAWLSQNATLIDYINPKVPHLYFNNLFVGEPYKSTGFTDIKVSYAEGFNKLKFVMQSNLSFDYAEARVTYGDEGRDIGAGQLGCVLSGSYAAGTYYDLVIPVNQTTFKNGGGAYWISIYVRSASDGTWSETYFLLTLDADDRTKTQQFKTVFESNVNVIRQD